MDRMETLEKELDRVGILGAKNFMYFYDCLTSYDASMYKTIDLAYPKRPESQQLAPMKTSMNHFKIAKISYELGYNRILILESDIRFLKDLNELYFILTNEPEDSDVTLFDKMIWRIPKGVYDRVFENQIYLDYTEKYNLYTLAFSSAAFYSLSRKGMYEFYMNNDNAFTISDTYTNNVPGLTRYNESKRYVTNINCGIQESPKYYRDHYYPFVDFNKYNLVEQPNIEIEKYNFVKL